MTTIFAGKSLVIDRFDHPEHCFHQDPESEPTAQTDVTFVERGAFALLEDRRWWDFSAGDVLVTSPGLRRSYRHFESCPEDRCLSVNFAPEVVEGALGKLPRMTLPPRVPAGVASNFALRWVVEAVRSGIRLEIESAAFHCATVLGPRRWEKAPRLSGVGTYTRKIRTACASIAERPEENHSLTSLAAEAGLSPFYFARVFSELVGEPPHQYLLRVRLRHAARLLRAGASVAEAALKSGFPDVNHFSKTFRRRFGVPPSRYPS
ncbi:MAG TPA: helix-turn-helix transcriptional regulator [Pyrinomonadaceae bacterium]|nr:helix-turn-helix transcriptional regulator [Pyrinomonadaceae bacterium]